MKKRLLFVVLLAVVTVILTLPSTSPAACSTYGRINSVIATTSGTYLNVALSTTGTFLASGLWQFFIPSADAYSGIVTTAIGAYNANDKIYIATAGSSGICASRPLNTITGGGTVVQINIIRNY